jgi:hypothetical protein
MTAGHYRRFSVARIGAIAGNTLTDLTRQRVFYFILVFALILIGCSIFMARFSFEEEFKMVKDVSLGTMSIFSSLLAILATARLLPQDLEERTAYSILAKPVPRFEYVIGKLIGVIALLAIALVLMSALFVALMQWREQTVLHETMRQMTGAPPEQLQQTLRGIGDAGLKIDIVGVIGAIFLKAAALAALTLFITTFATTNIFTVMVMVFIYFIGHLQSTAREYWLAERGGGWLTRLFLAIVALVFPDLQQFNLVDAAVSGVAIPGMLFARIGVIGLFYIVVYSLLAIVAFSGKEL